MSKESVKPVEILTEEKLQDIEIFKHLRGSVSWGVVEEIITSHRLLLSANAELSFKNQKYKDYLNSLRASFRLRDQYADVAEIDSILEELK